MLGKLLKYEFRADAKRLLPILASVLGLAVLSTLLCYLNTNTQNDTDSLSLSGGVFSFFSSTAVGFSVFLIFASVFVVLMILMHRYYQNFFSDEGYLTFTLPVKESTHLAAKMISAGVWIVFSVAVALLSGALMLFFATAPKGYLFNTGAWLETLNRIGQIFKQISESNMWLLVIEVVAALFVALCYQLSIMYLAVTLGSIISKKHKVLASIGMYFAVSWGASIITSMFMVLFLPQIVLQSSSIDPSFRVLTDYLSLSMLFYIVLNGGLAFLGLLINRNLLKNKLNLD